MREPKPIACAHLFTPLNDQLVALLRSLSPEEWELPTVAGNWRVRDVVAHLLDTCLRRLSMDRDGYAPPLPPDAFANGLAAFVNEANRHGVEWLARLSSELLIDLHARYGAEMGAFLAAKDPDAPARWAVSWAGDEESPNWFDVARELTERWHHQQQIRDATGRPPLFDSLGIVLETFVRALPHTYRDVDAADGTALTVRFVSEGEGAWTLVRERTRWRLFEGEPEQPAARVTMRGDAAWRIFTKQRIDPRATIEGDAALAAPLFRATAIVA